jgi:DNA-binding transcriptional LysR family regulator
MRLNLDVLLILDALDKHGSFATAAESLFKTPAALSYMIQKLESDLNIMLLDRSGHRAKFTDTGRMMLEKGRLLLNAAKDLEKQVVQVQSGWEKELCIALDASFPFAALLPLIDEFHALNKQTRLNFTHHTLAGAWEELTHHGADMILGAINEPPTSGAWSYKMLGTLDNVFVVTPQHPLAEAKTPLSNDRLCLHRAVVISDSARSCQPINSNLMDEQPQILVDDFHSKVMLLRAGMGCGFLPRHIARPWLENGELVEKEVLSFREKDLAYMASRNHSDRLAQRWWREALLDKNVFMKLYQ